MKEIKVISELIDDEIEAVCEYTEAAEGATREDLKRLYVDLANVEMTHINKLHDKVKELITETRNKGVVPPVGMLEMWEHEHARVVKKVAKLKYRLETLDKM